MLQPYITKDSKGNYWLIAEHEGEGVYATFSIPDGKKVSQTIDGHLFKRFIVSGEQLVMGQSSHAYFNEISLKIDHSAHAIKEIKERGRLDNERRKKEFEEALKRD